MSEVKFVCNARFLGRQNVDGPLNDYKLSDVVTDLQKAAKGGRHHYHIGKHGDERLPFAVPCHVELNDKQLLVTYIRKDEGFESDTDSAKSVETPSLSPATASNAAVKANGGGGEDMGHVDRRLESGVDEKIIKDHVFRFPSSTSSAASSPHDISSSSGEDSYSSNGASSGSDSEGSEGNNGGGGGKQSGASSASVSPTAELHQQPDKKYKFEQSERLSIADLVICHTDKVYKSCVVWVVRKSGSLEALVFECMSEENARQLYRRFHEASKRSKLERHKRRKSDGGSIVTSRTAVVSEFFGLRQKQQQIAGTSTSTTSSSAAATAFTTASTVITTNTASTFTSPVTSTVVSTPYSFVSQPGEPTSSILDVSGEKSGQKWSLVQHTDRNGVTHIEVESSGNSIAATSASVKSSSTSTTNNSNLVRQRDTGINIVGSNGHAVMGGGVAAASNGGSNATDAPRSLVNFSPAKFAGPRITGVSGRTSAKTEKSKFAKELESILSGEIRRRDELMMGFNRKLGGSGSGDNGIPPAGDKAKLISSGTESEIGGVRGGGRSGRAGGSGSNGSHHHHHHGESLSLRQRAPAMILRKLDEFEEKAHKIWAKAEADEENRKVWSRSSNSVIGISSPSPHGPQIDSTGGNERKRSGQDKNSNEADNGAASSMIGEIKQQNAGHERTSGRGEAVTNNNGVDSSPTSGQSGSKSSKARNDSSSNGIRKGSGGSSSDDSAIANGNRILVPTKTGKEPAKKLYPKESPPVFSSRFLPLTAVAASQPHSLPLFPVALAPPPHHHHHGWTRYPPPGEMSQLDVWKYSQESWRQTAALSAADPRLMMGAAGSGSGGSSSVLGSPSMPGAGLERSRSRDRSRVDPDHRRRAQSKSPARRPSAKNDMLDVSALNIGRMFRDFGDAVRSKMSRQRQSSSSHGPLAASHHNLSEANPSAMTSSPAEPSLKSNLKKQKTPPDAGCEVDGGEGVGSHNHAGNSPGGHHADKKVHFNKFATVQMMG